MSDFSLNACYESVVFEVETLKVNVFEELGRAIIRAEQDVFYNKTMIVAYKNTYQTITLNGMNSL